ncbi:hypothetical protein PV325_013774 [Microctonus aethiopoides]|uniref:Cytochrome c oxidase subunit 7C, mitochondrial n=1 Tax=Microctonus aethiopoides TaxID=144406 RepID=A0AA39KM39_9HYME|nr:hypothetical protein PV325_013774 [Microctonus aethiopoides]KAK0090472.1 hypothetical protein PV326_004125 [Microctonus aethiopoides]KAK0166392.1 hypothetical protein PV328_004816 [Microctonus aethiopoides]
MIGRQIIRRFTTSVVRKSGNEYDSGARPGSNLPFDITNKYKLTAYFILFFGSAFSIPFLAVRHQLLK